VAGRLRCRVRRRVAVGRATGRSGVAGTAAQPVGDTCRACYGRWPTGGLAHVGGGGTGDGAGRAGGGAWPPRGEADGWVCGDGAAARLCCRGVGRRRATTRRGAPTAAGRGGQRDSCACVAADADSRPQRGGVGGGGSTPAAAAPVALGPPVDERSSEPQVGGDSGGLAGAEGGGLDGGVGWGLEGVASDSDDLEDATPPSPRAPLLAPDSALGHQPGVVAMAAAVAMQVASAARFRRSATGAAVLAAPFSSTATFFATATPVGSRRKARPSPTTSPAGTRKVLRTPQKAAARLLHLTAASAAAGPSAAGDDMGDAEGGGTCMDLAPPAPAATVNPSETPPASLPLVPRPGAAVPTAAAAPDGGTAPNTVSDAPAND